MSNRIWSYLPLHPSHGLALLTGSVVLSTLACSSETNNAEAALPVTPTGPTTTAPVVPTAPVTMPAEEPISMTETEVLIPADSIPTAPPEAPPNKRCAPNGEDADGDGYNEAQGDCNECDANSNPGALDVPGNGFDEDCNGIPDDVITDCDAIAPAIDDADPWQAARSIGLCQFVEGGTGAWGVVEARYVQPDGSDGYAPESHGLLPDFGTNVTPRDGASMVALSSGTARRPSDPAFESPSGAEMGQSGQAPPGFPGVSTQCPDISPETDINDPIALELVIRVPTNAQSFSFDFNFYTFEFPEFVCQEFNDFFVALVDPPPPMAVDGNISFDTEGNPVSVNNAFLQVCEPQSVPLGRTDDELEYPCERGPAELEGTGFDDEMNEGPHAATGWLSTLAPVQPGSLITVRFAIWDAGDAELDSTVLIDNFKFSAEPAEVVETVPLPLPLPK